MKTDGFAGDGLTIIIDRQSYCTRSLKILFTVQTDQTSTAQQLVSGTL